MLHGFDAVSRAADIAAHQGGPDLRDPREPLPPCDELELEQSLFLDDPITLFYGVGSEMLPEVTRSHVRRHGCQGLGGQTAPEPYVWVRR